MRISWSAAAATFFVAIPLWAQQPGLLTTAVNTSPPPAGSQPGSISVEHCDVKLDEEAEVPAQEAGVIMKINIREGDQIQVGDTMAQIDDAQAQKQRKNATAEFKGAQEKSNSDIDVRYAAAAAEVAKFEYQRCQDANKKTPLAFSDVEMAEKKFAWDKAVLAIEQAKKQHFVDGFTTDAKQAEVELADESVRRRQINAPIDGVVQRIYAHLGEWVKPGDSVVRLMRMDRLRVEGYLDKDQYSPGEVAGRPVNVQVVLANGRKEQFKGKVVFVDPEIQGEHDYKVRAEVDNRKDNGQWLLRPGMPANMTIQLR